MDMENFRAGVENGLASLQNYLSSVEVRGDTRVSLVVGVVAGLVIVIVMAAFPGKPIDYTGIGIDLPPGLRGENTAVEDIRGKSKKHDRGEPAGVGIVEAQQKPDGLQQIQGVIENLSELRRRKRAKRAAAGSTATALGPAAAATPAPAAASEDSLVHNNGTRTESDVNNVEGDWNASRLNEDKLARKIGSSKAARMLGLTEDQVRQAVVDAKEELQQSQSKSGGHTGSSSRDDSMGASGILSLTALMVCLGGLWVFVSTNPHGTLSRFLIGVFPREMETLGLVP